MADLEPEERREGEPERAPAGPVHGVQRVAAEAGAGRLAARPRLRAAPRMVTNTSSSLKNDELMNYSSLF